MRRGRLFPFQERHAPIVRFTRASNDIPVTSQKAARPPPDGSPSSNRAAPLASGRAAIIQVHLSHRDQKVVAPPGVPAAQMNRTRAIAKAKTKA